MKAAKVMSEECQRNVRGMSKECQRNVRRIYGLETSQMTANGRILIELNAIKGVFDYLYY